MTSSSVVLSALHFFKIKNKNLMPSVLSVSSWWCFCIDIRNSGIMATLAMAIERINKLTHLHYDFSYKGYEHCMLFVYSCSCLSSDSAGLHPCYIQSGPVAALSSAGYCCHQ